MTVQQAYERLLEAPASGPTIWPGSGVFWFRSFRTVSCIASSQNASTSSRSCTFTDSRVTGGHGSEALLHNNAVEQTAGSHSLAAAAHRERYAHREAIT